MDKTIFYEKQSGSRNRLLITLPIVIIAVLGFSSYFLIRFNYKGNPFELGTLPILNVVIIAVVIVIITLVVIVYNSIAHIITKITRNGITVYYFPFGQKRLKIKVGEILNYKIRTYNAYREYWGYGVKENRIRGKAYIIKGKDGLQLYLKSGKSLLIGTQKKQAIEYAMKKLMGRENSKKNG